MAKTEIESINGRTIVDVIARQKAEAAVEAVANLETVEMVVTFEDGTTARYVLCGQAVTE